MAFPNISDILATTIESRTREVADNVSNSNAILSSIKKVGGLKTVSGGSVILEEFSFAENSNTGWYSGADTLSLGNSDVVSGAQYQIKQASSQVVITGLEQLQNSGKEQMIDMLETRIDVATSSLENLITKGIYSDGLGSAGKQLDGLKAAISLTPTTGTYGLINRATWAFWRNRKSKGGGVDFAGALTKETIYGEMLKMYLGLSRGADKPNLIVMDENYYALYVSSLTADQRFSDVDTANRGFNNVTFMGTPVVFEPQASGMPANTAYFLNTKYLRFRPHAKRHFASLELGKATNQDVTTHAMTWAGNLTCRGARFQGVIAD